MNINELKNHVYFQWLDFNHWEKKIIDLRKEVFQSCQGIDVLNTAPKDEEGLHLGAFYNQRLVSVISAFIYKPEEEITSIYPLPPFSNYIFQLSRRAELEKVRGSRLAELMATSLWKSVYETLEPDYSFITLLEDHKALEKYYGRFGYKYHNQIIDEDGEKEYIYIQHPERMKEYYVKVRTYVEALSAIYGLEIPQLFEFLQKSGRIEEFNLERIKQENLYLQPLSLKDELPRLSTQARLLYTTQKDKLEDMELPAPSGSFLDLGCGPGVYLSNVSKNDKFANYKFTGIDINSEMITYAKLSYNGIKWKKMSVYETNFENNSFDVVHGSFIFIHLMNPELVLKEISRIIKTNGKLYVVDVNDATFDGPPIIKRMLEKHNQYYEGNRKILKTLPRLSEGHHFSLEKEHTVKVTNEGREGSADYKNNVIKLGKMSLWGLFSFIGQREEIKSFYHKAEKYYYSHQPYMSIDIQTQIYRYES
ncbi:MAG: class I SAM-dependent methyltransferase [Bacteroidales bacterium]|nr:class I SAM-dependent methyltransferase [Bacteroidales bacterium]